MSVDSNQTTKVTIPAWAPYSVGLNFAIKRGGWIREQKGKNKSSLIQNKDLIGKSFRVVFVHNPDLTTTRTRINNNQIIISSNQDEDSPEVQAKAVSAAEKALRQEADKLLPQRLDHLASTHGFSYQSVKVRKLTSRWGSCSTKKDISLSIYLMQLPWNLIDYVLIHELMHTRHMHHGPIFWSDMTRIIPKTKELRKIINTHQPRIKTNTL